MTPEQLTEAHAVWERNPMSYRGLFDGVRAVPVEKVLAYLEARGHTRITAIGKLASLTQLGKLQMISLDLVQLGPKPDELPAWLGLEHQK